MEKWEFYGYTFTFLGYTERLPRGIRYKIEGNDISEERTTPLNWNGFKNLAEKIAAELAEVESQDLGPKKEPPVKAGFKRVYLKTGGYKDVPYTPNFDITKMKEDTLGDAMKISPSKKSKPKPPPQTTSDDTDEHGRGFDDPAINIQFFMEKAGIEATVEECETLLNASKETKKGCFRKMKTQLGKDSPIVAGYLGLDE